MLINPYTIKSLIETKTKENHVKSIFLFLVGREEIMITPNRKESMPIYEVSTKVNILDNPFIDIIHKTRYPNGYSIDEYRVNINHITFVRVQYEVKEKKP